MQYLSEVLIDEKILMVHESPSFMKPMDFEQQLMHLNWIGDDLALVQFILHSAEVREMSAGDVVFQQSAQPDGVYILGD